jgi:hypothetical protein
MELLKYIEMETQEILKMIQKTEFPLKRQLLVVELLIRRYRNDLDWYYLEKKAILPENETLPEMLELKKKVG